MTGQTPILVGHSLGSVLARDYAARHSVPGLGLASFGDIAMGMKDFMMWMTRRYPVQSVIGMITGRPSALFAKFEPQHAVMYDGQPENAVRANVERLMIQPGSDTVFSELGKLKIGLPLGTPPILIMAGDRDVIGSPRSVAALAELHGVAPVILAGLAHDIFANPDWHVGFAALDRWLSMVTGTEQAKPS